MTALMKFMRFERSVQATSEDAARLRFLMCQNKGGISMIRVMSASTGTATAVGAIGKLDSAMIILWEEYADCRWMLLKDIMVV